MTTKWPQEFAHSPLLLCNLTLASNLRNAISLVLSLLPRNLRVFLTGECFVSSYVMQPQMRG